MNIGDMVRKAAEVFVDFDEETQQQEGAEKKKTDEKAANGVPDTPATPIAISEGDSAPSAPADPQSLMGAADVASIYSAARIVSPAFTAEQMLEMLASLPPELPLASRRQMMHVTLNAIQRTL